MAGDIDWGNLHHAYGPATNVPELLARIEAGDAGAVETLRHSVAHQGWASTEVACVLAPRLWALTGATRGRTRADLLRLLADLACLGDHEHFVGTGVLGTSGAGDLLGEDGYLAVRHAVAHGWPDDRDLLVDRDARVRSATALLLAATTPDGAEAVIVSRLGVEKNRAVRADLLAALGWLPEPDLGALEDAVEHGKGAERTGAAIALAMHRRIDAPLAGILVRAKKIKGSAWLDGNADRHALAVFLRACERDGRDDLLSSAFENSADEARDDIASALMATVFAAEIAADAKRTRPPHSSLTSAQRSLFELCVEYECGWWYGCDFRHWCEQLGFPTNPVAMAEYLGHAAQPASILERRVDGRTYAAWIRPLCTKEPDSLATSAAAVAASLSVGHAMELAESFVRIEVPWGWTRLLLLTHVLTAMGPDIAEPAQRRIERIVTEGVPSYWNAKGSRCSDPGLGYALLAACRVHDRSYERPADYPLNTTHVRLTLKATAKIDRAGSRLLKRVLK